MTKTTEQPVIQSPTMGPTVLTDPIPSAETRLLPETYVVLSWFLVLTCALSALGLSVLESFQNVDCHHWGLMYAGAHDFFQGKVPYKELFIPYGILTTAIQAASLAVFGDQIQSIGFVTGVAYSLNIILAFIVWRHILPPIQAAISSVLMFLIQGYITYPWPNFFAYTFFLVTIKLLLTPSHRNYAIAGIFLGLSCLARETLLLEAAPVFYCYMAYDLFRSDSRRQCLSRWILANAGFLVVILLFILWLKQTSLFSLWLDQSRGTIVFHKQHYGGTLGMLIKVLRSTLFSVDFIGVFDLRTLIYSLIFVSTAVCLIEVGYRRLTLAKASSDSRIDEPAVVLILLTVVFGLTQNLHLYSISSLQCSSALGIGLLVFVVARFWSSLPSVQLKAVALAFLFLVTLHLSASLVLAKTSASQFPWTRRRTIYNGIFHPERVAPPPTVAAFKGKWMKSSVSNHYGGLADCLDACAEETPILVNLTMDSFVPFLSDRLTRVQISPYYAEDYSKAVFPSEQTLISEHIKSERATIVAQDVKHIPGHYVVIGRFTVPVGIPYLDLEGTTLLIAVPRASKVASRTWNQPRVIEY